MDLGPKGEAHGCPASGVRGSNARCPTTRVEFVLPSGQGSSARVWRLVPVADTQQRVPT